MKVAGSSKILIYSRRSRGRSESEGLGWMGGHAFTEMGRLGRRGSGTEKPERSRVECGYARLPSGGVGEAAGWRVWHSGTGRRESESGSRWVLVFESR